MNKKVPYVIVLRESMYAENTLQLLREEHLQPRRMKCSKPPRKMR